jgi:prolyl 4-hydroxylase
MYESNDVDDMCYVALGLPTTAHFFVCTGCHCYYCLQEYTGHHDFGFSRIDDENQGARFATLLLYLNSGVKGGATSFPRWANAETFHELRVEPEAGKAVLFYSQLPDGNLDDLSHHAAMPVLEGEKWLINLWTWSPIYD